MKTLIDKYLNHATQKYLYVCFVDFKCAFDSVWRQALTYKLIINDVGGNILNILVSVYGEVRYCVKPVMVIQSFISNVGVKQGSVLSPILFNLFMADLTQIFGGSCDPIELYDTTMNCLLYADDLVWVSESAPGLQFALDRLHDYCERWKLTVNLSKTKIIIFNPLGTGSTVAPRACRGSC